MKLPPGMSLSFVSPLVPLSMAQHAVIQQSGIHARRLASEAQNTPGGLLLALNRLYRAAAPRHGAIG